MALLVLAIRHGDRMALAMDARAFGSGPRTCYREVRWRPYLDVAAGAALVLGFALWARRRDLGDRRASAEPPTSAEPPRPVLQSRGARRPAASGIIGG